MEIMLTLRVVVVMLQYANPSTIDIQFSSYYYTTCITSTHTEILSVRSINVYEFVLN